MNNYRLIILFFLQRKRINKQNKRFLYEKGTKESVIFFEVDLPHLQQTTTYQRNNIMKQLLITLALFETFQIGISQTINTTTKNGKKAVLQEK